MIPCPVLFMIMKVADSVDVPNTSFNGTGTRALRGYRPVYSNR